MESIVTVREFLRNFARLKRAAAKGNEIVVRDLTGNSFVFRAKGPSSSLAEQLSDLQGAFNTGVSIKSLEGFGCNRP
jgi:hypothetical protein